MKINEIFLSIQGEGLTTGQPTIFIRTTGCNLRCSYCDTKYSYEEGTERRIEEILDIISKYYVKRICITGGEPLLQNEINDLIEKLLENDYEIDIETNGSISLDKIPENDRILISMDIKCPSSGENEKMNLDNLKYLSKKDQVKFIINDKNDFFYAKNILINNNLDSKTNVFFHPVDGIDAKNLVDWTLEYNLDVRIGLQIHKIIWSRNTRGV